jgi:cell division protein FtsL
MQPEVRYINAYVSGTAVKQPVKMPQKKPSAQLPKARRQQKLLVQVDIVSLGGILAALVLGIMLIVGVVQMNQTQQEAKMMREYALSLQQENKQLQDTYTSSYDLEEVQRIALSMGMVPSAEVEHLTMQTYEPEITVQPTAWENFWAFLAGMFA